MNTHRLCVNQLIKHTRALKNLMNDIVVSTYFSLTTYSLCLEQRDHKGSSSELFEALVPHNKQLVITSDTYTRGLKDIEPRLISRLSQGLSVAIEPPEFEMRTAILLNKAKTMGVDLPDEVAAYIAKRLKSNVRELEGALQQVVAYQQFQATSSREITIDIAKRVLREQFQVVNSLITIENIQKNCCGLLQNQSGRYALQASSCQHSSSTPNCHVPH